VRGGTGGIFVPGGNGVRLGVHPGAGVRGFGNVVGGLGVAGPLVVGGDGAAVPHDWSVQHAEHSAGSLHGWLLQPPADGPAEQRYGNFAGHGGCAHTVALHALLQ
jgi:hypothetical protein